MGIIGFRIGSSQIRSDNDPTGKQYLRMNEQMPVHSRFVCQKFYRSTKLRNLIRRPLKLLRLDFDFDYYFQFHLNLPFYKYNNGTTVLFHHNYILIWQIFEISNIK